MRGFLLALAMSVALVGCGKSEQPQPPPKEKIEQVKNDVKQDIKNENEVKEQEYLGVLRNSLRVYSDNMGRIHEQYAKVEKEKYLLIDANWRTETKGYFDAIKAEGNDFSKINNVPENYQEIHSHMVKAFTLIEQSGNTLFGDFSKSVNNATLEAGANLMLESTKEINTVNNLLKEKIKRY